MQQFINNNGVDILISDDNTVYIHHNINSESEIELYFDSVEEAENRLECRLEEITEFDVITYQDKREFENLDLDLLDTD